MSMFEISFECVRMAYNYEMMWHFIDGTDLRTRSFFVLDYYDLSTYDQSMYLNNVLAFGKKTILKQIINIFNLLVLI